MCSITSLLRIFMVAELLGQVQCQAVGRSVHNHPVGVVVSTVRENSRPHQSPGEKKKPANMQHQSVVHPPGGTPEGKARTVSLRLANEKAASTEKQALEVNEKLQHATEDKKKAISALKRAIRMRDKAIHSKQRAATRASGKRKTGEKLQKALATSTERVRNAYELAREAKSRARNAATEVAKLREERKRAIEKMNHAETEKLRAWRGPPVARGGNTIAGKREPPASVAGHPPAKKEPQQLRAQQKKPQQQQKKHKQQQQHKLPQSNAVVQNSGEAKMGGTRPSRMLAGSMPGPATTLGEARASTFVRRSGRSDMPPRRLGNVSELAHFISNGYHLNATAVDGNKTNSSNPSNHTFSKVRDSNKSKLSGTSNASNVSGSSSGTGENSTNGTRNHSNGFSPMAWLKQWFH